MFREQIEQGGFVVTVEMVPGRGCAGAGIDAAVRLAERIREAGLAVHALSLTDLPGGGAAISPDGVAREVQGVGIDALVHVSCRDFNRNSLEARAWALARAGLHNLLVLTGDYPVDAGRGRAKPVFDLDSVQALRLLAEMNAGLDVPSRKGKGTERLPPTRFFCGAAVSPFKATEEELVPQFVKMEKKIRAGAAFIVTQLGYDLRKFLEVRRYLAARGLRTPVIGYVYVLTRGAAETMHRGGVPGCVVTDELLAQLTREAASADKGRGARLERAAKMVAVFRGTGFGGVHIGGFGLKYEDVETILERAGELAPRWEEFVPEIRYSRPDEYYLFPPPDTCRPDAAADPDPLPCLKGGRGGAGYAVMRGFHRAFFDERSPGYRAMRAWYRAIGDRGRLARFSHFAEHVQKLALFDCQDCGDCALPDLAYCCPMGTCEKNQRNGPCGGSVDGTCEAHPGEKPCAWTVIYRRMKSQGKVPEMPAQYNPPRDPSLQNTSGWANYYLGRDTHGRTRRDIDSNSSSNSSS